MNQRADSSPHPVRATSLGPLLGLFVLFSLSPGEAGTISALPKSENSSIPELRLVVARESGACEIVTRTEDAWTDTGEFDTAWLDVDGHPPERIQPGERLPDRPPAEGPGAWLTVSVPTPPSMKPEAWRALVEDGLYLLAGPQPMWSWIAEDCLPAWQVPVSGEVSLPVDGEHPWRLRAVAEGWGSWWVEVPADRSAATLRLEPAETAGLTVQGPGGEAVHPAKVGLRESGRTGEPEVLLGTFATDERGRAVLASVPASRQVFGFASSPEHPITLERWRTGHLPPVVRLAPGTRLTGRLLDPEDRPLAGVRVKAVAWAHSQIPLSYHRWGTSGENGRFEITALPRREAALEVAPEGFVPRREHVELDGPRVDLPAWTLEPGIDLTVRVVDELGAPVPGARLLHRGEEAGITDPKGRAEIGPVSARRPLELSARAPGHIPRTVSFELPLPEELVLRLANAFQVLGRFETDAGEPVAGGAVEVHVGNEVRFEELSSAGAFELDLAPGREAELVLRGASVQALRVPLTPGEPGERRDLGVLRAPAGLEIHGRVVSSEDGLPVAGARVWMPRLEEGGETFAWFREDFLEARSDADGLFRLQGAPQVPQLLRIEAPRHARHQVPVEPPAEGHTVDLGEITLEPGATVEVRLAEPAEHRADDAGPLARLDLRGQWREADMLTAAFTGDVSGEERAHFPNVPEGTALLTVLAGRQLLCEEEIEVPGSGATLEVWCEDDDHPVRGWVRVGGEEPGSGELLWLPRQDLPAAVIVRRQGPLGLQQTRTLGQGRPQQEIRVAADGRFEGSLSPGSWQVMWRPDDGGHGSPKEIEIPEGPVPELLLDFPPSRVTGVVLSEEGDPVPGARVRELTQQGFSRTGADGSFEIGGLRPGLLRLRARSGDSRSPVTEVPLPPDRAPEPAELVLGDDRKTPLRVRVVDAEGRGVPGAFVFVQTEDASSPAGSLRLLTTRSDGAAELTFLDPVPESLRAAASAGGRWILGSWHGRRELEASEELVLEIPREAGQLLISSQDYAGALPLETSDGWDLSALMLRLGRRLQVSPDEPALLNGLPPGLLRVRLPDAAPRHARVEAGETARLELR